MKQENLQKTLEIGKVALEALELVGLLAEVQLNQIEENPLVLLIAPELLTEAQTVKAFCERMRLVGAVSMLGMITEELGE